MKKVPNLSPKNLLEVKRKREYNIKYAQIKRDYEISYNDIIKIVRFFSGCNFESDIKKRLTEIDEENKILSCRDSKKNYIKYRKYYLQYSRDQYKRRQK